MFKRFCLFSFRREPNGLFAALEASCGLKVHYFILNHTFTVLLQIESEDQCTSQLRTLIDQISLQQGQIVSLEGLIYFEHSSLSYVFLYIIGLTTILSLLMY